MLEFLQFLVFASADWISCFLDRKNEFQDGWFVGELIFTEVHTWPEFQCC